MRWYGGIHVSWEPPRSAGHARLQQGAQFVFVGFVQADVALFHLKFVDTLLQQLFFHLVRGVQ